MAALFHDAILMPDFFPCSMACASAQSYVVPFHQVASQVFPRVNLLMRGMRCSHLSLLSPPKLFSGGTGGALEIACASSRMAPEKRPYRVSSFLPSRDESSAHLVSFKHLLVAGHEAVPCILRIEAEGYEMTEIPLKLV